MIEDRFPQVPHLTTATSEPLQLLEKHLLEQQPKIEAWLRQQWRKTPPPIYGSVDLRNAGFKLAPVDTNLFPAGFNNLNNAFLPLCIQAAQAAFERAHPGCLRLLLIPENHTRNTFYFESLATLQTILLKAGFEVRIGSLLPDLTEPLRIDLPSGRTLQLEPLVRKGNRVGVAEFSACVVLLNHDLSDGIPDIVKNIEQTIVPPLALGWFQRSKATHFGFYKEVSREFAELIGIDPWLIDPLFLPCDGVDFLKREGEQCLVEQTQSLLDSIQQKYTAYGIDQKPYVVIKADSGTYGMGILTVQSADELVQLNRKERTRMSSTKGNQAITKVLLQEGVYTFETWGEQHAVAEPVVYMIGQYVIGGFYRVHTGRASNENLNAPGMHFEPLAFASHCHYPDASQQMNCEQNRFYAYGVIARLALVAAAREIAATE